uniref:Uncharacterized protein n=1 Tax=Trichobilharzia regenti TaxID=157069 RepID=A0AA85JVM3_TRIRE|nr:unnamed protein product [Trichobilharzia regenti]
MQCEILEPSLEPKSGIGVNFFGNKLIVDSSSPTKISFSYFVKCSAFNQFLTRKAKFLFLGVNKIQLVITGPEVIVTELNPNDTYTCSVKSVFGKNLETENYKPAFKQVSNGTFTINQNVLSFSKDSPSGVHLFQCHFQIETFHIANHL